MVYQETSCVKDNFSWAREYVENIDSVIDTTVKIQPCTAILCQLILNGIENL